MSDYTGTISPANLQAVIQRIRQKAQLWTDDAAKFESQKTAQHAMLYSRCKLHAEAYTEAVDALEAEIKREQERILTDEVTS